jgi:hypothetical protein
MNPGDVIGSNLFRRVALKNQAGHLSGETNSVRTQSQSDRDLSFGTPQIAWHISGASTEKPSVIDGRQRTNCSAALSTAHRKQAE